MNGNIPVNSDYVLVFDHNAAGQKILDQLIARFGNNPYTKGGLEAQRETDFKAGQLSVIHYILNRVDAGRTNPEGEER